MAKVREALAGYDASHDIAHIKRVFANAVAIAKGEEIADEEVLKIVRLAALLHDVGDAKYSDGSEDAMKEGVSKILLDLGVSKESTETIIAVIDRVSFRKELAAAAGGAAAAEPSALVVSATQVVQDADRLDAIGAVGIARCFSFGGAKGRTFYDDAILDRPTREALLAKKDLSVEEYTAHSATTVGHFYAKLLRLAGMMKVRGSVEKRLHPSSGGRTCRLAVCNRCWRAMQPCHFCMRGSSG